MSLSSRRTWPRWGAALAAIAPLIALGLVASCDRKPALQPEAQRSGASAPRPSKEREIVARQVRDVGPPAPALIVLSALKGYTEPCGCTLDVTAGGIDRIVGVIEELERLAPASAVLDTGDVFFEARSISEIERAQDELKAKLLARAYAELGVDFAVPGPYDFALGVPFYEELTRTAKMSPRAINLTIGERALEPSALLELDGVTIGIIGAVDAARFEGVEGVRALPVDPSAIEREAKRLRGEGASAVVLAWNGAIVEAKTLLDQAPSVDFASVGAEPRETDQLDPAGRGFTLETFDQGRHVGVLKFYDRGGKPGAPWVSARTGSSAELEKIDAQIAHVDASIAKLPPAAPGEEPPMLRALRDRLGALNARRDELKAARVEVPEEAKSFLWRTIRLEEGYPEDAEIKAWRDEMNLAIRRVNASLDIEIPAPAPGQAFYVGSTQCKSCHADAYAYWETTNHAHALQTLIDAGKEYDQDCIGCHVVGYEEPGGSALGKLTYSAPLGEAGYVVDKDLRNVGCEVCHGPGSAHTEAALFGELGDPKDLIVLGSEEATCSGGCHVTEHSPRFVYDVYRDQILGPGHGEPAAK